MAGSIRQRGTKSWELRAFVGKDASTGKKQYVTRTIRGDRREAEIALGRLLGEVDDGQHSVRPGTVGELCEKWFAHAEPDLSPSVAPQYRHLLDNRILPRWGAVPLRQLRTSDLDLWYSELRKKGSKKGGPLAPNTVMRTHAVLRRALAQGVRWGWLTTNPAANATLPKARKQQMTLPAPADVARLIAEAAKVNTTLPTYFRLAAATGARRGEMCALRWKHVDFERRRLTIERGIVVGVNQQLIEKDTKTHQARRVTLDAETTAILLAHQERCAALVHECGGKLTPDAFLFSHEVDFSKPWRPDYATLAFGRLRDQLGLKGVNLHHLRHFSATQLLSLGIDVRTVSGRLGHANASTTLDIYAHFIEQADERAADVLGALLGASEPAKVSHPVRMVEVMQSLIVFDGDDTLWGVENLYDEARDRAAAVVAEAGLDPTRWDELQHEIDVANVATLGLSRLRFPHSSVAAYERAALEAGVQCDEDTRQRVRSAAASVFEKKAPLLPGARKALSTLGRNHRLALLTQGDPVVQEKRIADSGLRALFDVVSIVERKDESSFAAILHELGAEPNNAWSVGNSIPSDINPALRLGMAAIWIEAHVWAHEKREDRFDDGRLFECDSLADVSRIIQQHSLVTK